MSLTPSWTWGDVTLTESPFLMAREDDAFDAGAPTSATEALAQLLVDGEIEVGPRASNRTLEFTVYVESADLLASAEAERLLALEADKARNSLTFDPGDGYAPATVYETFRAQLTFVRDDQAEEQCLRRYDVSMKASPFGRSAALVETQAQSQVTTPTVATINDASSLTGWTSSGGSTLTDIGADFRYNRYNGTGVVYFTYSAPSVISFTTLPIISLDITGNLGPLPSPPPLKVNNVPASYLGVNGTMHYWRSPTASGQVFNFGDGAGTYNPGSSTSLTVVGLYQSDALPNFSTTRQKQRTVQVAGSSRTQGSLAVEHPTSALGSTLVYTWPPVGALAYTPTLRSNRRVSGGTPTPDSSLISGGRDLLDTALVMDVPVAELISGTHLLMARVRSDTNGDQTINWSTQTRQGSTNVGTATSGSLVVPFSTTPTTWRNVVLGRMMLPPTDVPTSSSAVVRVTIVAATAAASNIDLDEAWLFNTSVGDLSWVECGTTSPAAGGSSNRLWLDSASLDRPRPAIYRGFADDRSDAFYPGSSVLAFGQHTFSPPLTNVFTVTSGALDAAVSLSHFPRWHTHAGS